MSNTGFPDSAVVYILDDIPGQGEFQATGVIIGPHTILTAAHLLYDADTGSSADALSLYPGYTPGSTNYNPTGALGGVQAIHFIKVPDENEALTSAATQADFAVIDTSADLTPYGRFALDPDFTSGDVVTKGYPASSDGRLAGVETTLSQDGALSDIATTGLPISRGDSGGPLYDTVERNGALVPAVVGTVSTDSDAMKLTRAKVARIRHWIRADRSLYGGGPIALQKLVPQIAGTVSGAVNAAHVGDPSSPTSTPAARVPTAFTYSQLAAAHDGSHGGDAASAMPRVFADLVTALQAPSAGDAVAAAHPRQDAATLLAAPHAGAGHGSHVGGG